MEGDLARIIHDGSSAPLPHPPPKYGGGCGRGAVPHDAYLKKTVVRET